ncbi:MAG TPA: glycosyltransferase family 2 protein [Abditibacteriaceae bacterium]|jgi:glycosyltransferase involved in cell wall biosynthesis
MNPTVKDTPRQAPLFSVITPTFNCAAQLQRTADSLTQQDNILFEHILIDGLSTDETVDVIRSYADQATHAVRWVSEKDRGIYDAMNKGIDMASGRFLLFLGAGDLLRPGILQEIAPLLPQNTLAFFYGNALMEGGHVYGAPFDKSKIAKLNICHQAIFYGREVFHSIGKFELQYRVLADHAFNIKCFGDERIHKIYVDRIISEYEADGFSAHNADNAFTRDRETLIKQYLGWKSLLVYRIFQWELYGPTPIRIVIHGSKELFKILLRRPRGQRKLDGDQ